MHSDVLEVLIDGDVNKAATSQFSAVNKKQIYKIRWCISISYFIFWCFWIDITFSDVLNH